jgi:hypothetical protein
MVKVIGPYDKVVNICPETGKVLPMSEESYFQCEASTLREAMEAYCNRHQGRFRPYDGNQPGIPLKDGEMKYFLYWDPRSRFGEIVVDVHVCRNDLQEICAKQDLDLLLEPGDEVTLGTLAC